MKSDSKSRWEDAELAAKREADRLAALIKDIRSAMADATDEKRLEIRSEIMDGYCPECGCHDPTGRCQCWNDE